MKERQLAGFLLTRQWRDTASGIQLEYWLSTPLGPVCARVPDQRSVFFITVADLQQVQHLLKAEPAAEQRPLALKNFCGEPVVGIYWTSYRRARRWADELRRRGVQPLEADINPADRYLMERFITGSVEIQGDGQRLNGVLEYQNPQLQPLAYRPVLKVLSLDIETAMQGLELYSIAVHGVDGDHEIRRVFMIGEGAEQAEAQGYVSQAALLEAFLSWLGDYDPDVLIGWNVVNFDAWYLQRLADQLGVKLTLGRGAQTVHWRELDEDGDRHKVHIPGRVILDGIELLRAASYRFESFSLENVARQILGDGKLIHGGGRGEEIGRLFREDKTRLAAYNLKDCELVSDIFAATNLLQFALARSDLTGLALDRMGGSVASFDNLYLPRLHRRGYVAPNASDEHKSSPGGFVLESNPGLYDHVLLLDFKSLYPSIIRSFCIDPLGLALGTIERDQEQRAEALVPGYLGAQFAREDSILPVLIEQLWKRRDEARLAGDEPLSQAIKIIMSSFYGVLGTPGCRFFDTRLASSITLRGQEILGLTRDYIERAGHRVIYGDTDSVFVWIQTARCDEDALATGRALEQQINDWWRDRLRQEFGLESVLQVEFESHYKRFVMPTVRGSDRGSKKRYAGLVAGKDGDELVFKGLENVRSDWTRLARDFQQELYRRVFFGEPFAAFVCGQTAAVLAGERDADLVYRKRLRRKLSDYQSNVPPHVQAARLYVERDLPAPRRGDWIEYVITGSGAEPAARPQAALDYQHYVDRQLQPVADGILYFVGSSFRKLVDRQIELF